MSIELLLLALVPSFLYAASNHIDNILLEKYFKEGGVGTLMLFSALLSILAVPIFYFIEPDVLGAHGWGVAVLIFVGFLNIVLLWAYLQAIFTDEPTVVIIFYQLVPVLGLILGYFVLGETISTTQAWAMAVIIAGALILTVALDEAGKIIFRLKTALYMLLASFCWALESTLFKLVALEENVWRSLFWEHVALVVIGVLLFLCVAKYRNSFIKALKMNSAPVLGLNVSNEAIYIFANSVAAYVVILIPVSLMLLMNSFQPLFVLVLGYGLMFLLPKLEVEHVNNNNLVQKLFAILLTGYGVYLLGWW